MNIAFYLTFIRIALSPLFLVFYLYYEALGLHLTTLPYVLILLLGISELTDLFDGFFARKRNQVTELGKFLDPLADSIFRLSVFLAFTQGFIQLPLLLVLFLFYRDSAISTLRAVCALRGIVLAARFSGKIKAVVQGCSAFLILVLMIPYSLGYLSLGVLQKLSFYLVFAVVIYSVGSGIEYIRANMPHIKRGLR